MICDLEDKNGSGPAGQSCLARRGNPRFVTGDGVFARNTQNTVSGLCGILVFWYSGPAPRKTRFWGAGTICIWHVARGGLDFRGKNEATLRRTVGGTPCTNEPNFGTSFKCQVSSVKQEKS